MQIRSDNTCPDFVGLMHRSTNRDQNEHCTRNKTDSQSQLVKSSRYTNSMHSKLSSLNLSHAQVARTSHRLSRPLMAAEGRTRHRLSRPLVAEAARMNHVLRRHRGTGETRTILHSTESTSSGSSSKNKSSTR